MRRCIVFILCISLGSFSLKAQITKLAFFGGPQMTSAHYTVEGIEQPTRFKPGLMAGAAVKVPFDNNIYFFPAIYYSLKGYKVTLNNPSYPPTELATNNNTTIHTIEIAPLFNIDLSKKPSHFFVRFGPAVDFALYASEQFDTVNVLSNKVGNVNRPMKFDFTAYGRITASANLHFGFETQSGFMIFAHYAYGIGSLNDADGGPHILHRVLGLSAGWFFKWHPKPNKPFKG
ncbi:MAG TPA: porin family protein [Flavisolibacter sp.]|nr:porin family protein [Flavisolibacter sp.]